MRTFIALELPPPIQQSAGALQERLGSAGLKLRWVTPGNLHLTIRFLGEVEESLIESLGGAIGETVRAIAPISLTLQGLGVFPDIRRPNVLWIGVGGDLPNLQALHERLEAQLQPLGFDRERRRFKAHLTLARIKERPDSRLLLQAIQEVGRFEPVPFTASDLTLFRSDLRRQGAQYTPLAVGRLCSAEESH